MKKNIITISRQFGSGGRTVGHLVAEKLGIPFYDKELVEQIAKCSGENVEFHTFPNAGHGLSYTSDPLRYEWICYHFLASIPRLTEYFKNNDYVYEVLQRTL